MTESTQAGDRASQEFEPRRPGARQLLIGKTLPSAGYHRHEKCRRLYVRAVACSTFCRAYIRICVSGVPKRAGVSWKNMCNIQCQLENMTTEDGQVGGCMHFSPLLGSSAGYVSSSRQTSTLDWTPLSRLQVSPSQSNIHDTCGQGASQHQLMTTFYGWRLVYHSLTFPSMAISCLKPNTYTTDQVMRSSSRRSVAHPAAPRHAAG